MATVCFLLSLCVCVVTFDYFMTNQYCFFRMVGHVPTKHRNNRPLGRWVSTQRHMYKDYLEGKKPKSLDHKEMRRRIEKLEAIGFAWSMLGGNSSDESNDSVE